MACTLSQVAAVDDRLVLAGIARPLVHRLAEVDAVVEDLVDRALVDRLARPVLAVLRRPRFRRVAGAAQLLRQLRRRADAQEPLEDRAGRARPPSRSPPACGRARRSRAAGCRPSTCPCGARRRTCRGCARRSPRARTGRTMSRMLSVSRPIDVVVLNCCVMLTNEALCFSNTSTILAKSVSERLQPIDLVDDDHVDDAALDVAQQPLQRRPLHACRRRSRRRRSGRRRGSSPRASGSAM